MGSTAPALGHLCVACLEFFRGPHTPHQIYKNESAFFGTDKSCRLCAILRLRPRGSTNHPAIKTSIRKGVRAFYVWTFKPKRDTSQSSQEELVLQITIRGSNSKIRTQNLVLLSDLDTRNISGWKSQLSSCTNSESSIAFLTSKLRTCRERHDKCNHRFDARSEWRPTRLLDISNTDSGVVYLRAGVEATSQPFMTLSHCWGSSQPFLLTSETEASLRGGIATSHFPKTFQDAVYIAHRLSVRYIWIDSLCIQQDSPEDWQREAPTMCDVYSQALCNIAATGAIDSSVGLFFERDVLLHCPFLVHFSTPLGAAEQDPSHIWLTGTWALSPATSWTEDVELSPLSQRAWVMQERLLSTRVMHFSRSQVYWECLEDTSGEVFSDQLPDFAQPDWSCNPRALTNHLFRVDRNEICTDSLYVAWRQVLIAYNKCNLSKDSDKLVAISGIGQLLSRLIGDELVYGLWRSCLLQELCWGRMAILHDIPLHGAKGWWAPTWSWASSKTPLTPSQMRNHTQCDGFRIRAAVQAMHAEESRSGQFKRAILSLRGKLFSASFKPSHAAYGDIEIVCNSTRRTFSPLSFCVLPDDARIDLGAFTELVCVRMFDCECLDEHLDEYLSLSGEKKIRRYLEALALRPCGPGSPDYVRVGKVVIQDHEAWKFYMEHESEIEHDVKIV